MYVGEPIPPLNESDNSAFLLLLQNAALMSLKEKSLLTAVQYDQCVKRLERQFSEKQKDQRRV